MNSNMLELDADALVERLNAGRMEEQEAAARIAELEAELEKSELAYVKTLRQFCEERMAAEERVKELEARQCEKCEASIEEHFELTFKIAERDRQIAELEARLKEAEARANMWEHNYAISSPKRHALNQRAEAAEKRVATLEAELGEASQSLDNLIGHNVGMLCVAEGVRQIEARLKEAEAKVDELRQDLDVEITAKWKAQARAEKAEANAGRAHEQIDDAVADLVKANALYSQCLNGNQVLRANLAVSEERQTVLRTACQNLADAVARTRKTDDAVSRNSGFTADWDEHEDAHASLIIFENAARAALRHAEAGEGER